MMLKCADIGHLAADVATHKRWAYQLEEEFFRQVSHYNCFRVLGLGLNGNSLNSLEQNLLEAKSLEKTRVRSGANLAFI